MEEINKAMNFIYTIRIKYVLSSASSNLQTSSYLFYISYLVCFTYPLDTPVLSVIIFTSFTEPYLAKKLLISASSIYGKEFDYKSKYSAFDNFNYTIKEDLMM